MKQNSRAFGSATLSVIMLVSTSVALARQSPPPKDQPPPQNRELVLGPSQAPAPAPTASQQAPTQARPELVVQSGTNEPQVRLAFSPDGRIMASIGIISVSIRLWEVASGRLLRQIVLGDSGLEFSVLARPIRFSPDSRTLIAATGNSIRRWDVANGRELPRLAIGSPSYLHVAAISGDGQVLAETDMTSSDDIHCWDTSTGRELGTVLPDSQNADIETLSLAISPNGDRVAALGTGAVTSRRDGRQRPGVWVWDTTTGQPVRWLEEPSTPNFEMMDEGKGAVAFSADGSRIAARDHDVVTIWSLASGSVLASARLSELTRPQANSKQINPALTLAYGRIELSPDGRLLVVCAVDGSVHLIDTTSGTIARTLGGQSFPIVASAYSPDGRLLALSGTDGVLRTWDVASGTASREFRGATTAASDVAFTPDGQSLVVASRQAVGAWNVASGDYRRAVALPEDFARPVWTGDSVSVHYLSADGRRFAAGSSRESIAKIWDVTTGAELKRIPFASGKEFSGMDFNADGRSLALIDRNNAATRVASVAPRPQATDTRTLFDDFGKKPTKGDVKKRLAAMEKVMKASQSGDPGEMLKRIDELGLIPEGHRPIDPAFGLRVVDVASGQSRELPFPQLPTSGFTQDSGETSFGSAMALSPDGRLLAMSPLRRASVSVVEVATGRQVCTAAQPNVVSLNCIVWTPDGTRFATAGFGAVQSLTQPFRPDFAVRIWDAQTGAETSSFDGLRQSATAVAFSSDGSMCAVGGLEGAISMWDVATGRELRRFEGHAGPVVAIAFSPDGPFLLSGSEDGSARLWDSTTGELLATLVCLRDSTDWLVATPDGLFDGSPGGWNQILWRFAGDTYQVAPVESYFFEFFRPGLLGEILAGKHPRAAVDVALKHRELPKVEIALAGGTASAPVATRTTRVHVSVSEAAAGAEDVRLFRNGSLVRVWRGDVLKGGPSTTLESDVTLVAGENRLTAYAFNRDNVKSVDAALTVRGADSLVRAGTLHVLAVGVNEYANAEFNLRYAMPDANDFAAELERQQRKVGAFATIEVTRLVDREATKANVLLALARLSGAAGETPPNAPAAILAMTAAEPEDAVVVFFAGHGTAHGDRFYLLPHDLGYSGPRAGVDAAALQAILENGISDIELEGAVEGIDAGHALLVIDACHSGQALESEESRRGPMNSKGLAQLAYDKGLYVLTAAQSYQAALEATELGHGLLTYALVEEGLKTASADDAPVDGSVELREWLDFAANRVPALEVATLRGKRDLVLASSGTTKDATKDATRDEPVRPLQRPRAFYRREPDARPLVVARP